jgi:hypothetical protein
LAAEGPISTSKRRVSGDRSTDVIPIASGHNAGMAISVVVREHMGEVVARAEFGPHMRHNVVGRLAQAANTEYARFPLLAGVDPYDDTTFNQVQCRRLVGELADLRRGLDDDAVAVVDELGRLARMVIVDGPGKPHHRRLVFIGD